MAVLRPLPSYDRLGHTVQPGAASIEPILMTGFEKQEESLVQAPPVHGILAGFAQALGEILHLQAINSNTVSIYQTLSTTG